MEIRIALAGNPNSGKTTLFNALTGANRFVGNWPGVTVEKKEGRYRRNKDVVIADLPGIYSLSPYTLEEVVAREYLIGERPDAILNIVDGTNLERNLYLTTQLVELGIPTVVALNMMDAVSKKGDRIDAQKLEKELGVKVVGISALKGEGIAAAAEAAISAAQSGVAPPSKHRFSVCVERALDGIEEAALRDIPAERQRWYAVKIFERDEKIRGYISVPGDVTEHIESDIADCEKELDDDAESIITAERYNYISSIIGGCVKKRDTGRLSTSDKIDRIVTNRWLALPIFVAVMALVYIVSVTTVGTIVTDWTNDVLFGEIIPPAVDSLLESIGCWPWLHSLVADGIVAGVGAVLGFVPQMFVLFLFLAFLEGCGYMARIAFILDRIFRRFGLSGKSFIPMLISSGCGVPGIMACRTIENDRDRKMTVMTTTFIPCGAKLPIIALIGGALFDNAWWVSISIYLVGIAAVIVSGIMLKKTKLFAGDPAPFVMELPAYHLPTAGNVLRSMWERGRSFIKKAGSIILLSSIVIWFLSYFGIENGVFTAVEDMNNSLIALLGGLVAPLFAPLGFGEWKAAASSVLGLVAKENLVTGYGIFYGFAEASEDGAEYWGLLAQDMTRVGGYAYLVFNMLCAPCFAAIGAIKREMNSAKWTWTAIGYQCALAYVAALCINQIGAFVTTGAFGVWTAVAFALAGGILYMLFRKNRYNENGVLSYGRI